MLLLVFRRRQKLTQNPQKQNKLCLAQLRIQNYATLKAYNILAVQFLFSVFTNRQIYPCIVDF